MNSKSKVLSVAAGLAMFTAVAASAVPSTVTQNSTTLNVTNTGTNFTFNTFNSALGTLTAVDLFVNSSTLQGSFSLNRTSSAGTTVSFTGISASLFVSGASGSGLGDSIWTSSALTFNRTPSGNFALNNTNPNRSFTIDGTSQSIISTQTNVGLSGGTDFDLSYYIGDGSTQFNYTLSSVLSYSSSGSGTFSNGVNNVLSPTALTLQYTYTTDPAPVPEPGQVAASLLLLSGIGAYVFIKRRKKSAPAAA